MTTRQATGIALKIFALYLLFSTVIALPALIAVIFSSTGFYLHGKEPSLVPFILTSLVSLAGCGLALWLLWKTANSLLRKDEGNETPLVNDLTIESLMKLVLSCMGLYLAIHAVLALLSQYASAIYMAKLSPDTYPVNRTQWIVPAAQFLIGCLLIAKPRKWATLLRSIGEK